MEKSAIYAKYELLAAQWACTTSAFWMGMLIGILLSVGLIAFLLFVGAFAWLSLIAYCLIVIISTAIGYMIGWASRPRQIDGKIRLNYAQSTVHFLEKEFGNTQNAEVLAAKKEAEEYEKILCLGGKLA